MKLMKLQQAHLLAGRGKKIRPTSVASATILFLWLLVPGLFAGAASTETVTFDGFKVGAPPPRWTATKTGDGEAKWSVEVDPSAPSAPNVLKQSGVADYPVCFATETRLKDGFVAVKFKAISGGEDQAGGVVWRAKDANNYYVARANALEDNVTVYHVVQGVRTEKKRVQSTVAPGQWHSLRVDFTGSHFAVVFDGKQVIEWNDHTFSDAGMVGVWTKSDSVTAFDDFSYGAKSVSASHAQTNADLAIAVQATAARDCGCGECAAKGCKPCRGKNCYYCVAKGLVTTECGCGTCTAKGCEMCGPGCDVCKFNLAPVAAAKARAGMH